MGTKNSKNKGEHKVQTLPTIETKAWTGLAYEELNSLLLQHGIKNTTLRTGLARLMVERPTFRDPIFESILEHAEKGTPFTLNSFWNLIFNQTSGKITLLKFYRGMTTRDYLSLYCIATEYNKRKKYVEASEYIELALKEHLKSPIKYTNWPDLTRQMYQLRASISKNIGNQHEYRSNMILAISTCNVPATRFILISDLKNSDLATDDINQVYEEYCTSKNTISKMAEKIQMLENEVNFRPGGIGAKIAGLDFEEHKKDLDGKGNS